MSQLVTCLCCGAGYPADDDCPYVEEKPHSAELALAVACYLQALGIEHPDTREIEHALKQIGEDVNDGG